MQDRALARTTWTDQRPKCTGWLREGEIVYGGNCSFIIAEPLGNCMKLDQRRILWRRESNLALAMIGLA